MTENSLISKSRPLLNMRNSGYTLGEFKLLDLYLARINPLDPKTSRVTVSKKEYCKLMEIDSGKVRSEQLKKYTAHFLGNVVTLDRPDGKRGYIQKVLFTTAEYDEDAEEIVLECNPEPLIFNTFFNVKNIGYVRYILKNTLNFKSAYSYKLFTLAKSKLPAREFQVELPELREKLGAHTQKRYESFKYFNQEVLSVAVEEINNNTDTFLEFTKVTKGRLTKAIRFKATPQQMPGERPEEEIPGQMNVYDYPEFIPDESEIDEDPARRRYALWSDACNDEFNQAQIEELSLLANAHVEYVLGEPERHELNVFHYLRLKYKALNAKNQSEIKSRYGYMKWLVENDG